MDQLVAVNRSNWKVVFRSNDNRIVLYNPNSHEFRTTNSSSSHPTQWSSLTYFEILENHLMLQYHENEGNPSLSEFLLDGYFSKYFTIQKKIGSGGTGSVYHVKHQLAGYTLAEYAVKIVPIGIYSRLRTALSEVKFLQKLSLSHHPFILGYYHCWIENYQPAILGPQVPCLFILMEYSKYGNLETFLKNNQNLNYKAKWQIFIQILLALNLLHKEKIIHRDLKMSNILIFDDDNNINENPLKLKFVLSDFGTAITEEKQIIKPTFERTGATGTIETMAPELLEQNNEGKFIHSHSFSSDIWSLGVIFFNIFIGKNPFASDNGEELLRNFTNVDNLLIRLGIYNSDLPNEVMDLIRKMMDKRSYNRITIKEILKNQVVDHFINEFNYTSLVFNFSSPSSTFSEHKNHSDQIVNSSLLPVNPQSILPKTNQITYNKVIERPTITIDEFHRSTPLAIKYSPRNLNHKKNYATVDEVNEFDYSQKENEPWNIHYKCARTFYHTKIMAKLLPFYHDHLFFYFLPISKNENREPYITNSSMLADQFIFDAKITDNTTLKIDISKIRIKNNEVKLPEVTGYVNGQKIISVKKVKIFINKDKYFQAKAKSFHLHDRPGMFLEDAITEIKLSCHMIASYLFSFNPNEESLKFPFILTFDRFNIKFHETDLNQSIVRASQILPKINRESMIRQFLLNKKKTEMKLDKETVKEAEQRLSKLAFRDYKSKFENNKRHKYSFHFVIEKCSFTFDSRNFTQKIKMIHQIDPTTKVLYNEMNWDLMLGFNFEFKASTFKVFSFDIKEPIINVDSMNLKGPTIIANGQFVIDKEVIPLSLNPSSMILFTDMLIAAESFDFYYGFPFQSIYQELTIRLYGLLPKSIDPTPRFAWFDLFRACFRGQFIFKADSFDWRIPATSNFRETGNYMSVIIEKFHLLCKEGEFALNLESIKTPRFYNGKKGPAIFELPKTTATVRFSWESEKNRCNGKEKVDNECDDLQKNFIVIPDVKSFKTDGYDTYKYFRAKKIFIDDLTIFFSKTETVAPTITVDIAHLKWLIQPITYAINNRHVKSQIAKKLGFRELQRPPYAKFFIQLNMTGHIKVIGDTFVVRIFDHFPVNGSIQGSSIDFTFHSFTCFSDFGFLTREYLSNLMFKCDSLSLNATDLSYYTYGGLQTRSPTILILKPFHLEYEKEVAIKVNEILFHLNQLLLKYLIDFITSINLKLTIPGRLNQLKMQMSDFPVKKASVSVNCGKVFITSLESDLQVIFVLDSIDFDFLSNNEKQNGYNIQIASISMVLNGKVKHRRKRNHRHKKKAKIESSESSNDRINDSNDFDFSSNNDIEVTENDDMDDINEVTESYDKNDKNNNFLNPFLTVINVSIFFTNRNMINSFGNLSISATTNDVSIIKYLWTEFWTDNDQPSTSNASSSHTHDTMTEFEMSATFPSVKITATVENDVAEIDFESVTAVMKKTRNRTKELMLMVMNATVKNLSKDAPFPEAFLKWNEQSVAKANRPHIQILLKIPPKIKYAHIFSQAEVNMEPSIVNYDAKFWESFMVLINARFEKKPPKSQNQFIISAGTVGMMPMPFVVYDQSLFPATSKQNNDDFSTNKTIRVKKANHDEHIILMFRYLRINPILMNVTYRNSDNKILSEINNFQGQMHEIIYHDLTTTVEDLVSKVMYDVAKDVLPQFLKHVVGFKKWKNG